jgi:serine protease
MSTFRFLKLLFGALGLFAVLAAGTAQAQQPASKAPVNGLIVRLHDAPQHAELARERAASTDGSTPLADAAHERLQKVLREAGLDKASIDVPSAPTVRALGSASHLLRFSRPLTADEAERLAQRLRQRPEVRWVVLNKRERRQQTVEANDPEFTNQWWLKTASGSDSSDIAARLRGVPRFQVAWDTSTGVLADATRVAVLDSGITEHPELVGRVLAGYDMVTDAAIANDGDGRDRDPADPGDWVTRDDASKDPSCIEAKSSWHGTIISGLIAALTNNKIDVAGINWSAQIVPVRVAGKCGAEVADIADGIRWAAGLTEEAVDGVPDNPNPARIINISFGGTDPCDAEYQAAIDEARAAGALVIAAAGNEHQAPTRPASCDNVIGVGALNRDGFKTTYSNYGSKLVISTVGGDTNLGRWGSLLTDGGLLTLSNDGTTVPGNPTTAYAFGTSFSAPLVSGAISLMWGVNPDLTTDQIVEGLRKSARPHVTSSYIKECSTANPGRCLCTTSTCGAGMLDAAEAVRYADTFPDPYVNPNRTAVVINPSQVIEASKLGLDVDGTTPPTPCQWPLDSAGDCTEPGGALNAQWLLLLALATGALAHTRRPT